MDSVLAYNKLSKTYKMVPNDYCTLFNLLIYESHLILCIYRILYTLIVKS
jgi:hypothetical protein